MLKPHNVSPGARSSVVRNNEHDPQQEEKHTPAEVVEASVKGEDQPMEEQHPTAPGALVWFTFPAVLIIVLLLGLLVMGFMQRT